MRFLLHGRRSEAGCVKWDLAIPSGETVKKKRGTRDGGRELGPYRGPGKTVKLKRQSLSAKGVENNPASAASAEISGTAP